MFGRTRLAAALLVALGIGTLRAEPVIPGTGQKLDQVGDDFEDQGWEYIFNSPKSTRDLDEQDRLPAGEAKNGRWYEGMKRGHPDVVKRVPTPPGGLPGSQGSLLLQSLWTGSPGPAAAVLGPGRLDCRRLVSPGRLDPGRLLSQCRRPGFLASRGHLGESDGAAFWLPHRAGNHGRIGRGRMCDSPIPGPRPKPIGRACSSSSKARPTKAESDYAYLRIRADQSGGDFRSKQITTTGWWTLGMSVTPDGMVHYFAGPGVDNLTQEDYLGSQYPYGLRAEGFKTFFFNVCNGDDGRNWSTAWTIDDPSVFVVR